MNPSSSRRQFLHSTTATAALGVGGLGFLDQLAPVSAAEAKLPADKVRFHPDIEPLVRLLEETPRDRVIEEFAARVRRGTSYREVLAALQLAGVRSIQPRPVGFKFHAVLVVNSAHLASLNAPDSDRWLPIFWALDQFKSSQARNAQEGNWSMSGVTESAVPPAHRAKQAFTEAMDNWDTSAADAAVAGLARSAGAQEVFELFARYGARDFRDIGHKAIYVANSWRTLQNIGWQHAEPVLRSLAYALLEHEDTNPAKRDGAPDRAGRRNRELAAKIRPDWLAGKPDAAAATDLLKALRQANDTEAADQVVALLNRGVSSASVWDAVFQAAGELLIRQPAIISLHSVTTANALHYAFQHSGNDETRRWLLLQAASFLPMFRGRMQNARPMPLDELEAVSPKAVGAEAVAEVFADVSRDKTAGARKALGYLRAGGDPLAFIATARRLIYLKGTDSHDYKFSEAALEDYFHVSPALRDRCLAASVGWLKGSGGADSRLVERTRAAFKA
jgi:hypothetical protein